MSSLAVPAGGGLPDAVAFLKDKSRMIHVAREATAWALAALAAVKSAPDNPYGDDDEVIAGEILRGLESRTADLASAN